MKRLKCYNMIGTLILQIVILVFIVIICQTHKISLLIGIKYFLFQFWGILIPGRAVFLLFNMQNRDKIAIIAISYVLGLSFLVVEYLLLMGIGLQKYSFFVSIASSSASCRIIYKKTVREKELSCVYAWITCISFVIIVLVIGLFTVSFINTIPEVIDVNGYYVDWLFWTGNNISLTNGFPPQDFRLCGEIFRYHYFSSIIIAQSHFITGIDVLYLSFYFSFIIPGITLVLMAYTLLTSVLKNSFFIVISLLLILFTNAPSVTYIWHMYFCPFGFDYGCIFGMFSIYVLITSFIFDEQISTSNIILSAVSIVMTTGSKGPVAIVVLMGFAVVAMHKIIKGKKNLGIFLGMLWLGAFLVTSFGFIFGNLTNGSELYFLGVKEAFKKNPITKKTLEYLLLEYDFLSVRSAKIIALALYIYNANKTAMVLLLITVIYFIISIFYKNYSIIIFSIISICIWGIGLTITTKQSGGSEMYFIMSVIPYSIIGGFYVLEKIKGKCNWLLCILISGISIAGYFDLVNFINHAYYMGRDGYLSVTNQKDKSDYCVYYITQLDFDAYKWIENNTDKDDIIAIDSLVNADNQTQHMVAGVFSQRYIWNDGKYSANVGEAERRNSIVQEFMKGDRKSYEALCRDGVKYFLQTLEVNPHYNLNPEYGEVIYENERFRVYILK